MNISPSMSASKTDAVPTDLSANLVGADVLPVQAP